MGRGPHERPSTATAQPMKIQWTGKATSDLVRLHQHLQPVAREAAARVVQQLARAPDKLLDYPRLGEKLEVFEPREVRRIIVGNYELRYEIERGKIFILRLWHCRENRSFESDY